jgi:predicted HicB family RNase H-like nuclease
VRVDPQRSETSWFSSRLVTVRRATEVSVTRGCRNTLMSTRRNPGGRPSRGDRKLIGSRVASSVAAAVEGAAKKLGLSVNDYVGDLLAAELGFAPVSGDQHAGQLDLHLAAAAPRVDSGETTKLEATRVPQPLAAAVKSAAQHEGLSVSLYVASILGRHQGLHPSPPRQNERLAQSA